jgi:hypothetical protein
MNHATVVRSVGARAQIGQRAAGPCAQRRPDGTRFPGGLRATALCGRGPITVNHCDE